MALDGSELFNSYSLHCNPQCYVQSFKKLVFQNILNLSFV